MSKIICCLIHIAIAGLLLRKGDQDQQPLEDAKELDKLLRNVDEAMRALTRMSVDAERVTVALPQNAWAKDRGRPLMSTSRSAQGTR